MDKTEYITLSTSGIQKQSRCNNSNTVWYRPHIYRVAQKSKPLSRIIIKSY